jgi:hypothetical protein
MKIPPGYRTAIARALEMRGVPATDENILRAVRARPKKEKPLSAGQEILIGLGTPMLEGIGSGLKTEVRDLLFGEGSKGGGWIDDARDYLVGKPGDSNDVGALGGIGNYLFGFDDSPVTDDPGFWGSVAEAALGSDDSPTWLGSLAGYLF